MEQVSIKGVRIGSGRPKAIVSLMDPTTKGLLASAQRAVSAGADCLEWRADYARDPQDLGAMANTASVLGAALPHTPLVFTFRSSEQGGQRTLPLDAYGDLVKAVLATKSVDVVDVEASIGDQNVRELVNLAHASDAHAIVSHHDFAGTPDTAWMVHKLLHMASLGADLPKLAVMANSTVDCLHLMEATAIARQRLGRPLVTMAMGAYGSLSRLVGEGTGSALTFCALDTPSAPGQVSLEQAVRLMDLLNETVFTPREPLS